MFDFLKGFSPEQIEAICPAIAAVRKYEKQLKQLAPPMLPPEILRELNRKVEQVGNIYFRDFSR